MAFISIILSAIMMLMGGNVYTNIQDAFVDASAMLIYNNGQTKYIDKDNEEFKKVIDNFNLMIEGSNQMPAFGVSLDSLTKEELKKDLFIEFIFETEKKCLNMPFDTLLIKIQDKYQGFNIIRGNSGIYEGRCYYLDLKGSMSEFYSYINENFINQK